ncbi:hypothetical protein KY289_030401 [Solanum tuberosum]|nr:hypothetical protein KY289_030401 [Solanum tuberosum]
MTVVMEFYANLSEHEYQVCMVQGKTVNFAQEAIESAYNFPQFGGTAQDEYRTTYIKEPYKWDMFIEVICTSGQTVHWLKENHKFHSKSLNTEVKCWFHIITSRILPSTNTTEVHVRQPASIEEVGSDVDDVEELPDHVVPPTQSTQDSMGRSWAEQFHSLETQVDALHSSMADIHRKMNELTVKTGKSDRKILAWLRALGRTCTMDSSTVSDTD